MVLVEDEYSVRECALLSSIHSTNGSVLDELSQVDEDYTRLVNGEELELIFSAPELEDGLVRDFVLVSTGYYIAEPDGGIQSRPANDTPLRFVLRAYPNPARSETRIDYSLPVEGHVTLKVYNPAGQLVETLVNEHKRAGHHSVRWRNDRMGVYFCRLEGEGRVATKKITVLR